LVHLRARTPACFPPPPPPPPTTTTTTTAAAAAAATAAANDDRYKLQKEREQKRKDRSLRNRENLARAVALEDARLKGKREKVRACMRALLCVSGVTSTVRARWPRGRRALVPSRSLRRLVTTTTTT
jgi:hypothetical protein